MKYFKRYAEKDAKWKEITKKEWEKDVLAYYRLHEFEINIPYRTPWGEYEIRKEKE